MREGTLDGMIRSINFSKLFLKKGIYSLGLVVLNPPLLHTHLALSYFLEQLGLFGMEITVGGSNNLSFPEFTDVS